MEIVVSGGSVTLDDSIRITAPDESHNELGLVKCAAFLQVISRAYYVPRKQRFKW